MKDLLRRNIYVAGDPALDVYFFYKKVPNKENRLQLIAENTHPGCAENIYSNLYDLEHHGIDYVFSLLDETYGWGNPVEIIRHILVEGDSNDILNKSNKKTLIMEAERYMANDRANTYPPINPRGISTDTRGSVLVIGDYNKGAVNRAPIVPFKSKFKAVVIDSRYGTIWPGYTELSDCTVLHATAEEIYRHNVGNYKYVIHTNGPSPVKVYEPSLGSANLDIMRLVATLDVPDTKVVDPTGAGDTLVATIATYLAGETPTVCEITDEVIIEATKRAIKNCQHVIQIFGTATPTETIPE